MSQAQTALKVLHQAGVTGRPLKYTPAISSMADAGTAARQPTHRGRLISRYVIIICKSLSIPNAAEKCSRSIRHRSEYDTGFDEAPNL
jgi:hypothetical protein